MNTEQLFNSFCLVGKITTVHADQIKDQLKEWEKMVREEVEKESNWIVCEIFGESGRTTDGKQLYGAKVRRKDN